MKLIQKPILEKIKNVHQLALSTNKICKCNSITVWESQSSPLFGVIEEREPTDFDAEIKTFSTLELGYYVQEYFVKITAYFIS